MATLEEWQKLKNETAIYGCHVWQQCIEALDKRTRFIIDAKIKELEQIEKTIVTG